MSTPATLDHAGIAARVPHAGSMCLLHELLRWDADSIECRALSHHQADNPLREGNRLPCTAAIEYAAQAMALHAALAAPTPSAGARPGLLASVRGVQLRVPRLDDQPGALRVRCERLAGDEQQAMYRFAVTAEEDEHHPLAQGRATVVLNAWPAR